MMTIEKIKDIISVSKNLGHNVTVKDVSLMILYHEYNDHELAYDVIYGDGKYKEYFSLPKILFLKSYYEDNFLNKKEPKKKSEAKVGNDITFEENKAALINLLNELKKSVDNGEIEKKDAIKMESDIRTRLNDKFGSSEKAEQTNVVVVEPKFNYICKYTNRECYINSKEACMKRYNLKE